MLGFGIDVGTSSLKFSQISQENGQSQIVQLFSFELPNVGDKFTNETAQKLKNFLAGKKIRVQNAVVGISGKEVNIRYIKVMTNNPERISHIVSMELAQFAEKIEVPLVDNYMFLNSSKSQDAGGIVMLMIAHDTWLMELENFFECAGIGVLGYLPNSFGLYQTYSQFGKIKDKELVYLVHLDDTNSDLAIVYESNLYFLRNLNVGLYSKSTSSDEDEDGLDIENIVTTPANPSGVMTTQVLSIQSLQSDPRKVNDMLEASLKFARLQTGLKDRKIQRLLLTGKNSRQIELISTISKQLNCPVECLEFSEDIVIRADIQETWKKQSEIFSNALGLACSYGKNIPYLITQKIRKKRELWHKQVWEYSAMVLILLVGFFSTIQQYQYSQHYQEITKHTKERYAALEIRANTILALEEENQQLQNKVSFLQSQIIMNRYVLDSISWFQKNIPEQIYLSQISFQPVDQKRTIILRGVVEESNVDVYTMLKQFRQALETSFKIIQEKDPKLQEEGRLEFEMKLEAK